MSEHLTIDDFDFVERVNSLEEDYSFGGVNKPNPDTITNPNEIVTEEIKDTSKLNLEDKVEDKVEEPIIENEEDDTKIEENDNYFLELAKVIEDQAGISIDIDENEDINETSFWQKVGDFYKTKTEEELGLAVSEEAKQVYNYLSAGGTLNNLTQHLDRNKNLAENIDLSSEDGQKEIVRRYFYNKGLTDNKQLDYIIDSMIDNGQLEEESNKLFNQMNDEYQRKNEQFIEQQRKMKQEQAAYRDQLVTNTVETIRKSKDIYGISMTPKERKELEDYIFKPIRVKTDNGIITTTQADIARRKLQEDPVKYLLLLSLAEKNNFDFSKFGKTTKRKKVSKTVDNKSIYNRMLKKNTKQTKTNQTLDDIFNI